MIRTGDTTTSQFSQQELAVRFLERTQVEISQMSACLPEEPMALEPPAVAHIERMAHKISGASESFGFAEISAIAAASSCSPMAVTRRLCASGWSFIDA